MMPEELKRNKIKIILDMQDMALLTHLVQENENSILPRICNDIERYNLLLKTMSTQYIDPEWIESPPATLVPLDDDEKVIK